ncbi:MAG: DNRLRE domain-containing protein, partial [Patescibacteria group bacterium]
TDGTLVDNFNITSCTNCPTPTTGPTSTPTRTPTPSPIPSTSPTLIPTLPPGGLGYIDHAICNPDRGSNVFTNNVTNQYFPLSSWTGPHTLFNSVNGERVVMTVQSSTKSIPGSDGVDPIQALILQEYETINGTHTETSYNWFAQVRPGFNGAGTVCYMGEDVTTYPDLGHAGSWQAGNPGARAGIQMPLNPTVGMNFLIEDAAAFGAYEDGWVRSTTQTRQPPAGTFTNVVYIEEANNTSTKRYAPGVGMIEDSGMLLISPSYSSPTNTPGGPTLTPVPTSPPSSCGPTGTGQASSGITLPNGTGTYKIWTRMRSNVGARSYWLRVDNQCLHITSTADVPNWTWISAPQNVDLIGTSHTISLIGEDPGLRLDLLLFTPNINCTPTGFGDNCLDEPTPVPSSPPSTSPTPTTNPLISPTPRPTLPPNVGGTGISLSPIDDSRVLDKLPSTNYGSSNLLRINGIPSGTYREMSTAYLKFDLSSLASTTITSLKLRLKVQGGDGGSTVTQNIKLVNDNTWAENTINYSNAPLLGGTIATMGPTQANTWIEVNLPTNILDKKDLITFGIEACTECRDGLSLDSKETSNDPQLIVNGGAAGSGGGDDDDNDGDDD